MRAISPNEHTDPAVRNWAEYLRQRHLTRPANDSRGLAVSQSRAI